MAPTSTPPTPPAPAEATSTAHAVGGAFFRPADVASSSEVGIGTLLGGGETEYIGYSIDVHPATCSCPAPAALFLDGDGATTMGADAGAGFLGLRSGAGRDWRCCFGGGGEAWWRCAGRGRSGGCGKGLRAIIREAEFVAEELLLKDFKPVSISQSVTSLPNLVPRGDKRGALI